MTAILVFSHLRWGFVYQRPQHLLSRLAKNFRVVVIEEPIRSEAPARLERVSQGPNLELIVPHTPVEAPGFHDDQLSVLQPLLDDHLRASGIDDYLVWFYTPMALPLMAHLRPRAIVYDCMDELSAFKHAPRQLRQRETALLKLTQLVLTGGPALYESKRNLHTNVHCLPSSVDSAHFAPDRLDADSAPAQAVERLQGHLARPRLGFYGVIDERFDIELLGAIAAARPYWQFVMVGPIVKIDPSHLPRLDNIHWLGMQPYENLPYLTAGWDVCLMPFAMNESTRFISPTKTLEYMASGKPVVSTPVRDVVGLYGDVVRIAATPEAFVAACDDALAESQTERGERIRRMSAVVRRSSWDAAAERVRGLLLETLVDVEPLPRVEVLAPASRTAVAASESPKAVNARLATR